MDHSPEIAVDDRLQVCELHGPYRPREHEAGRPFRCRHCYADEISGASPEMRQRQAAARRERLLDQAGLSGRFRSATFDNFVTATPAQRAVLAVVTQYGNTLSRATSSGLFLLGPAGVGKSHLLSALARHAMFERGLTAMRITPRAIVRRLRATWGKGAHETEGEVVADLADDTHLLLLDEVGVGFGTDNELTQLLDVVDRRYELRLPTCLASNLTVPELRTALGDRLFDRLAEGAHVVPMQWPSHRSRAATE